MKEGAPILLDDLRDGRVVDLDERRGPFDRHCFRELAKLQRHRQHRIAVDLQHESGLHVCAEAGECDLQTIRSDRQVQQRVRARLVGDGLAAEADVGVCGDNGGARQDAAAGIRNGPVDLCRGLGPPIRGGQQQKHEAEQCSRKGIHGNSSPMRAEAQREKAISRQPSAWMKARALEADGYWLMQCLWYTCQLLLSTAYSAALRIMVYPSQP
jgi:hypothetical protein